MPKNVSVSLEVDGTRLGTAAAGWRPRDVKLKTYSNKKGAGKGLRDAVKYVAGGLIVMLASDPTVHSAILAFIGAHVPPEVAALIVAALAGGVGKYLLNRAKFYGRALMGGR